MATNMHGPYLDSTSFVCFCACVVSASFLAPAQVRAATGRWSSALSSTPMKSLQS